MKLKIKFTAFVASSIDGKIAKDNKTFVDWTSKEDWDFFQKSLAKFDVVVVGHNTYKIYKKRLNKRNTIVFTSKATNLKTQGSVIFLNPRYVSILDLIRKTKYKKIAILGGPKVYAYFLENKMLNEIFVTIEPIIFTAGVSMLSGKKFKKYNFILRSIKRLNKKGTLLLKYKK